LLSTSPLVSCTAEHNQRSRNPDVAVSPLGGVQAGNIENSPTQSASPAFAPEMAVAGFSLPPNTIRLQRMTRRRTIRIITKSVVIIQYDSPFASFDKMGSSPHRGPGASHIRFTNCCPTTTQSPRLNGWGLFVAALGKMGDLPHGESGFFI
jgi:hypothetical protein